MPGPLNLSLPTLFYVGAVAGLLGAFILLGGSSASRGEERGATKLFGWSMALGAAWMTLIWFEGHANTRPVPLAGLLSMGQGALLLQATLRLFGGRQPDWLIPSMLGLGIPLYLAVAAVLPPPASFLLVAGLHAAFDALAAFHAWRTRDPIGKGFRLAFTGLYGWLALLIASRVGSLFSSGEWATSQGVYASSPLHELSALTLALSPLLTALIVLGMLNTRMADRLLARAQTDELTGVHTRRHLLDEAPGMLARLRGQGRRSAVMMLDLDHFKRVNDAHGHRVGDLVLKRAAQTMRRAIRADGLLARYGGEEFCAIVPVDSESDALRAAERIRGTLSRLEMTVGQSSLRMTVSIGLSVQRGDLRFDELLAIADEGVYRAKAKGRNCVVAPGMAPQAVNPLVRPRVAPKARPA